MSIRPSKGYSPLHLAAKKGYVAIAKYLLEQGANIHQVNKEGNTALHVAAIQWEQAIIRLLLHYGLDINVKNTQGFTPLHTIVFHGQHDDLMQALIQMQSNDPACETLDCAYSYFSEVQTHAISTAIS